MEAGLVGYGFDLGYRKKPPEGDSALLFDFVPENTCYSGQVIPGGVMM